MHVPVMLEGCLEAMGIRPVGIYLDGAPGLGGHTRAIARRLKDSSGSGRVLACDRDPESLELARTNTADVADYIDFHQALFSQLDGVLAARGIQAVDGLLADLGVS